MRSIAEDAVGGGTHFCVEVDLGLPILCGDEILTIITEPMIPSSRHIGFEGHIVFSGVLVYKGGAIQ